MTNITENAAKLEIFGHGRSATTREIAIKNMPGPEIIRTKIQMIRHSVSSTNILH